MKNYQRILCIVLTAAYVVCYSLGASSEELTIVGTGSGTAILNAVGEAFHRQYPNIRVNIPKSIGSGGAIKAVGRDEYFLGRVAKPIKEKEQPYGLTYVLYAKLPIVFYVNNSVTVTNLSTQQILDIYSGSITNWEDVGGRNAKIRVVMREETDSSLAVLLELFSGFKDMTVTSKSKTMFNDQET